MKDGNPTEFGDLGSITIIQNADDTWEVFASPRSGGDSFRSSGHADAFAGVEAVKTWLDSNEIGSGGYTIPIPDAAGGATERTDQAPSLSQVRRLSRPKRKTPAPRKKGK